MFLNKTLNLQSERKMKDRIRRDKSDNKLKSIRDRTRGKNMMLKRVRTGARSDGHSISWRNGRGR